VSGSLTATGGVGALLQIRDNGNARTWLPTYDGNGNVVSLLNAGDGAIGAVYEYGPFGEPLRVQIKDATAEKLPFRFSTKFTDIETGLVYYGRRYYSPTLGRFITRDPIGEEGGANLYGFAGNDAVNRLDVNGLNAAGWPIGPVLSRGWGWGTDAVDMGDFLPPMVISGQSDLGLRRLSASLADAAKLLAYKLDFKVKFESANEDAGSKEEPKGTDCAALRAKYAKYFQSGSPKFDTAAEANLHAALRTAQFGGTLMSQTTPGTSGMGSIITQTQENFNAFFDAEYLWVITQERVGSDIRYSSTPAVTQNNPITVSPYASQWAKDLVKPRNYKRFHTLEMKDSFYALSHNHNSSGFIIRTNSTDMSSGSSRSGGNDLGVSETWGSLFMIQTDTGKQFLANKGVAKEVTMPDISADEIAALFECIRDGK
jgi:RHS repeat-associated protein